MLLSLGVSLFLLSLVYLCETKRLRIMYPVVASVLTFVLLLVYYVYHHSFVSCLHEVLLPISQVVLVVVIVECIFT